MVEDPSGTLKLVLWEEHVGDVLQGNTYEFCNIRVKNNKYENEVFVNTVKSCTSIKNVHHLHKYYLLPLKHVTLWSKEKY